MADDKEKIIIEMDDDEQEEGAPSKKMTRVLAFSLEKENYCVSIQQAKEIIKFTDITRVPNAPEFIVGIINLRGEIIPVLDIRYFFGLGAKEDAKEARILITDVTGSITGILVDEVRGTIEIEEESIQPPLATLKGSLGVYTAGQIQMGKDILILLDLEKVLKCEEIEKLRKGG